MTPSMRVEVNGEAQEIPEGATVADLLAQLGVSEGPVAVERNAIIVPRAQHGSTELAEGDSLEVVQFVGGG